MCRYFFRLDRYGRSMAEDPQCVVSKLRARFQNPPNGQVCIPVHISAFASSPEPRKLAFRLPIIFENTDFEIALGTCMRHSEIRLLRRTQISLEHWVYLNALSGIPRAIVAETMGGSASTAIRLAKIYGHIGQKARRESVAS